MTKSEFLDGLRSTLTGRVSATTVEENIRFYEDYFNTQMRMGKSEEEVATALGDPRILARSIIDAEKRAGMGGAQTEYEEVHEQRAYGSAENSAKAYRMPGWLIVFLVCFVIFLIIGAVFSVLSFLIPILFPVFVIVLLIRIIRRA